MKIDVRSRRGEHDRCGICHGEADGELDACASCSVTIHIDCRAALGKCPTIGCCVDNKVEIRKLLNLGPSSTPEQIADAAAREAGFTDIKVTAVPIESPVREASRGAYSQVAYCLCSHSEYIHRGASGCDRCGCKEFRSWHKCGCGHDHQGEPDDYYDEHTSPYLRENCCTSYDGCSCNNYRLPTDSAARRRRWHEIMDTVLYASYSDQGQLLAKDNMVDPDVWLREVRERVWNRRKSQLKWLAFSIASWFVWWVTQ